MVRTYKRKRPQRASFEVLQLAAEEVIAKKKSLRAVAMSYDIDKMTLLRFFKKVKDGVPYKSGYSHHKLFFTEAEEHELVNYLLDAAKMFFGLSPNETRKLAFEYAKTLQKNIPDSWLANSSAGLDWFKGFMKRQRNILSIRIPEATSLSRMTSFNRANVNLFYDNLENLYCRFNFEPQNIWNVDETGLTTVQKPAKIVAPKGVKQVGAVTSA